MILRSSGQCYTQPTSSVAARRSRPTLRETTTVWYHGNGRDEVTPLHAVRVGLSLAGQSKWQSPCLPRSLARCLALSVVPSRSVNVSEERHRAPGAKSRHGESVCASRHHRCTPYALSLAGQSRGRSPGLPRSLARCQALSAVPSRSVNVSEERHRAPGRGGEIAAR